MGRIYLQPARIHCHNTSWLDSLALIPDVAHSCVCPDWCGEDGPACAASSPIVLVTHPGREELLLHSSHPLFSAHWALDHAGWGPVEEKKDRRKRKQCCLLPLFAYQTSDYWCWWIQTGNSVFQHPNRMRFFGPRFKDQLNSHHLRFHDSFSQSKSDISEITSKITCT